MGTMVDNDEQRDYTEEDYWRDYCPEHDGPSRRCANGHVDNEPTQETHVRVVPLVDKADPEQEELRHAERLVIADMRNGMPDDPQATDAEVLALARNTVDIYSLDSGNPELDAAYRLVLTSDPDLDRQAKDLYRDATEQTDGSPAKVSSNTKMRVLYGGYVVLLINIHNGERVALSLTEFDLVARAMGYRPTGPNRQYVVVPAEEKKGAIAQ